MVSASLNPPGHAELVRADPPRVSLGQLPATLFDGSFPRWFLNSLIIASLAGRVSMFISACAAFAFSRFRFTGRRPGLLGLLLVQMFPQFLAIVAIYLIFAEHHRALAGRSGFNTVRRACCILYLGGALGVNTWLMKGFFDTIPKDLDESAKVDGATHVQVFFGIILPLVAPILAVTGLLGFIGAINEFLIASIFLTDDDSKTAAVGLYGLVADPLTKNANFGLFAAGAVILAMPTVALCSCSCSATSSADSPPAP